MRILLVVDSLDLGGAERHTVNLAIALRYRGHRVAVACSVSGQLGQELRAAGIPVHQLSGRPVKRRLSICYSLRLRRLLKAAPCDVLHAHCFASMAAAAVAAWRIPLALVITEHSEARWQARPARWLNGRLHHCAHGRIAVSQSVAERLATIDPDNVGNVSVIHNSLPPKDTGRLGHGLARCRGDRRLYRQDRPVVGVIARLHREKGVHVFLAALALLPHVDGLVLGDGPERSALLTEADRLGLAARIRFLPSTVPADELLSCFDVLAVPSLTEGSPLVVLEAMTAGVPVVASAVGGIPELIVDRMHGILVSPEDPAALATGISTLISNRELSQRLAKAARLRVTTSFCFSAMVSAVEQVYINALHRIHG